MSAWLVSSSHIDVLVQALAEGEHVTDVDPSDLGRELWRENVRSVNYRYDERGRTPSYRYRRPSARLLPSDVYTAVSCYQYQACERPDWERTRAYRWTTALRDALEAHPDVDTRTTGTGPWGFEHADVHGDTLPAHRVDRAARYVSV